MQKSCKYEDCLTLEVTGGMGKEKEDITRTEEEQLIKKNRKASFKEIKRKSSNAVHLSLKKIFGDKTR